MFYTSETLEKLPQFIREMVKRLKDYYYTPGKIPSLRNARKMYRNSGINQTRQSRSERRESVLLVLSFLLQKMDLVTRRVGKIAPTGDIVAGITDQEIAKGTGLQLRRVERAMRDLKAAGILTVHRITERLEDGMYRGYGSIRAISKNLFKCFGMEQDYNKQSRKATRRQEKKQNPTPRQMGRMGLQLNAFAQASGLSTATTGILTKIDQIRNRKPPPNQ